MTNIETNYCKYIRSNYIMCASSVARVREHMNCELHRRQTSKLLEARVCYMHTMGASGTLYISSRIVVSFTVTCFPSAMIGSTLSSPRRRDLQLLHKQRNKLTILSNTK
jgi:hypothetical protein